MRPSRLVILAFLSALLAGTATTQDNRGISRISIRDQRGEEVGWYGGSYALLIGVSNYRDPAWPDLNAVERELVEVRAELEAHGFKVIEAPRNPTGQELEDAIEGFLDDHGYHRYNRLLVFFSGHGYSFEDDERGFLVPSDAPRPREDRSGFLRKALHMSQIIAWSRQVEAAHVLFLFDSCFSGTIFKAKALLELPPHIVSATAKPVRQFISAGSAGETVPAKSVFTPHFARALRGDADLDEDGYVTGTELGMYLHKEVIAYRQGQTPQYGKIRDPDLNEGDFVFRLPQRPDPPVPELDITDLKDIAKMKDGFDEVEAFEQQSATAAMKAEAWQRFLGAFQADVIGRQEDDELRRQAADRLSLWRRMAAEEKLKTSSLRPMPPPVSAEPSARGLVPARTREGVPKKAVVIARDARLYTHSRGSDSKWDHTGKNQLMHIYFLLDGASGRRAPVSFAPGESEPDGWLEPGSFIEWNTAQMIAFEPQSGRELSKIFADADCAERFGQNADARGCEILASEPVMAGEGRADYALLMPVFNSRRQSFQSGVIRVTAPKTTSRESRPTARQWPNVVGLDLILVVDATAGMEMWFRPTATALRNLERTVKDYDAAGGSRIPVNAGLLFYRDRKLGSDCEIGYLTRWAVDLRAGVGAVVRALETATDTDCASDESAEAVYDGLNRAILDTDWNDGHFKTILLVGDAPPHPPSNRVKNPLGFTIEAITEMTRERNIRISALKIGLDDTAELEALALSVEEEVKGRFRAIDPDRGTTYERTLSRLLYDEWRLLEKALQVLLDGIDPKQLAADPGISTVSGVDPSAYQVPIVVARSPDVSAGGTPPEFIVGWVPRRIKRKLAVREHFLMTQRDARVLANVLETTALCAAEGFSEGPETFLRTAAATLAPMLKLQPDQVFSAGKSLSSVLLQAQLLPFKNTVLSFTGQETRSWKPADFERLENILMEKTVLLRAYAQKPGNVRFFGKTPHVYVPRDLFP